MNHTQIYYTIVQFLRYDYDRVGNVNWIQDGRATDQQQNFIYDTLDRLTQASVSGGDGNGNYNETYTYDPAGRLLNGPLGAGYTYGNANHLHTVTSVAGNSYSYDANGNVTSRFVNGNSYGLVYDAENRLTGVSGAATASFTYDGDGARVKGVVNGVATVYIGNHYEVSGNVARKYYYAGNQRIAMREGANPHLWLFNDHLGSTGYTYNSTTKQGELRYKPFGATRYTWGSTPTSYRYTGQREENALGLYYYGARWYDPGLGRFIQPDTIVPNPTDAKAYDRFAYVNNNPLKYRDPSGHCPAPAENSGTIICIDFFIQTDTILLGTGHGDGRSFDPDSDPAKSRAFFYLHLDDEGKLVDVTSHINPSCTAVGCFQPADEHNTLTATQDPESGNITLGWNLMNGVSSNLLSAGEATYEAEAEIGSMAIGSTLLEVSGKALDPINGEMTLARAEDGTYKVQSLDRDPFPSLEIYQYNNGKLEDTIAQYPERGFIGNLGPLVWLNPLAPNHRIQAR